MLPCFSVAWYLASLNTRYFELLFLRAISVFAASHILQGMDDMSGRPAMAFASNPLRISSGPHK